MSRFRSTCNSFDSIYAILFSSIWTKIYNMQQFFFCFLFVSISPISFHLKFVVYANATVFILFGCLFSGRTPNILLSKHKSSSYSHSYAYIHIHSTRIDSVSRFFFLFVRLPSKISICCCFFHIHMPLDFFILILLYVMALFLSIGAVTQLLMMHFASMSFSDIRLNQIKHETLKAQIHIHILAVCFISNETFPYSGKKNAKRMDENVKNRRV